MKTSAYKIGNQIELFLLELEVPLDERESKLFLTENEKHILETIGNPIRKAQYTLTRQFIFEKFGTKGNLVYSSEGKPFLRQGPNISISHTKELLAIALSPFEIGLDIEIPSDKLDTVKNRFLNENEKYLKPELSIKDLSFLWNLKEAALKYFGNKKIDYQHQIIIEHCDFISKAQLNYCLKGNWKSLIGHLITYRLHTAAIVF